MREIPLLQYAHPPACADLQVINDTRVFGSKVTKEETPVAVIDAADLGDADMDGFGHSIVRVYYDTVVFGLPNYGADAVRCSPSAWILGS